jgi:hypothetical protein
LSAGSGLLDSASSNLGQEAKLADQWRQSQVSDVNGIVQQAGEIATGLPFGGAPKLSPGTVSDPGIANYLANNGPAPGSTDWSGIDTSSPDMSIFDSTQPNVIQG